MSKNLLLEIGTEEMPANMMSGIVEQMHALAGAKLDEARIAFEKVDVYATPRRLAVIVTAAAEAQPDEEVKKRGHPGFFIRLCPRQENDAAELMNE